MKKFLSLLLLVPALGFMSSCSDDKDLPDVDFNYTFENATDVDGTLYVVQGEDFEVASIQVVNKDSNKKAMITEANYYWDYQYIGTSIEAPYSFKFVVTEDTPLGTHLLEVESPLYAEDKVPAFSVVAFKVEVVASADDIPTGGTTTTTTSPVIANHATHTTD
ncbi:MAG: hypothetical protein K2M55_06240 [Muribaculaceae bacterium]|nr:hypothetical protein [Muribaculaceae bacterium]